MSSLHNLSHNFTQHLNNNRPIISVQEINLFKNFINIFNNDFDINDKVIKSEFFDKNKIAFDKLIYLVDAVKENIFYMKKDNMNFFIRKVK